MGHNTSSIRKGCKGELQFSSVQFSSFQSLSRVQLFATPGTAARQAPLSMGFPRQEYWSGLPFPSPGDLPDPGIEPGSPILQADSLLCEPPGKPMFIYFIAYLFIFLIGYVKEEKVFILMR